MYSLLRSLGAPRGVATAAQAGSAFLSATPLTSFFPDGPPVVPPSPKFTKDTLNGWIMGHHPGATDGDRSRFQAIVPCS
jgi:hypothetical protein